MVSPTAFERAATTLVLLLRVIVPNPPQVSSFNSAFEPNARRKEVVKGPSKNKRVGVEAIEYLGPKIRLCAAGNEDTGGGIE
jgi:hypothetical protein